MAQNVSKYRQEDVERSAHGVRILLKSHFDTEVK